jgi:hypothetical protein
VSVRRKARRQEAMMEKVTHGRRRTELSWWPIGRILGGLSRGLRARGIAYRPILRAE